MKYKKVPKELIRNWFKDKMNFSLSNEQLNDLCSQIDNQAKIKRVREMKNPTILMNDKDLETFIKEVEAKVNNFKVGEHPTYAGIPIVEAKHIEQGTFIIYDNIVDKLFN